METSSSLNILEISTSFGGYDEGCILENVGDFVWLGGGGGCLPVLTKHVDVDQTAVVTSKHQHL